MSKKDWQVQVDSTHPCSTTTCILTDIMHCGCFGRICSHFALSRNFVQNKEKSYGITSIKFNHCKKTCFIDIALVSYSINYHQSERCSASLNSYAPSTLKENGAYCFEARCPSAGPPDCWSVPIGFRIISKHAYIHDHTCYRYIGLGR